MGVSQFGVSRFHYSDRLSLQAVFLNLTLGTHFGSISQHMLMIRLQRVGRKNNPSFRVVLTDKQNSTKSGRFLEVLGHHDFRGDKAPDNHVNGERIKHWISKGAQVSITAHNLLIDSKVLTGKKQDALPKRKPKAKEEAPKAAAKPAETPVAEAPPAPAAAA